MRSVRFVVAALALALTASMALTASSASASVVSRAVQVAPTVGNDVPVVVGAKVVKKRVRKGGPKRLVLTGAVRPAKGPVYIQRGTKCNKKKTNEQGVPVCNWKFYRKVFLKDGAYTGIIEAPPKLRGWVWRAKVGVAVSEVWVTCTKRPAQTCKVPF